MSLPFVHLHLHSQYSLLSGAIRLDALMPHLCAQGAQQVALTDLNNMYGAIDFHRAAKAHGIKPIFGSTVTVAEGLGAARGPRDLGQLVLLAKNNAGFRALSFLVSMSYLAHYDGRPRIDLAQLAEHSEHLIALTGGRQGTFAESFRSGGERAARASLCALAEAMPKGQLYVEVCDSELPAMQAANEAAIALAAALALPVAITCNAHFLTADDAEAHEILHCIGTQRVLDEARQRESHDGGAWVRSAADMWQRWGERLPDGLRATVRIADACNVELDLSQTFLPHYDVPQGHDRASYLAHVARLGLQERLREAWYEVDEQAYVARLEYELSVINKMGFAGYFLVVWDFIRFAKEADIPVGPGRGSGAGSLVAYSLRITDLDPLPYDLLFERFLNPDRVSMPDFDIDFCQDRRGEVIDYVGQKYGRDNVGQIVTYSLLSAKSVIKDVGRVLSLPFAEVNELTKLIPSLVNGKKVNIEQALTIEPKLREVQTEKPVYAKVIDIARKLEGLGRQTGMHAAGIVIGDKPLWEYVPVCRGKEGELVTQFAKDEVELAGLVKFDFLGLKTLTVIARAQALIRARPGEGVKGCYATFDAGRVPLNDKGVYKLISAGDTDGVFQLESSGFKELLKRLAPDRFEDVVAAVALYRPGPLDAGMVDDYIDRKHGRKKVTYPHPVCQQILASTYGVIVYQEQVMRIAVSLCGFSMGQADVLRKAMGKKKAEVMAQMREQFVEGAVSHSHMPKQQADDLFAQIEKFAGYAFNKSHSAAYAVISYQTAYLKTYFPTEFMAALLSTEMRDQDNVVRYINSAKEHRLTVQPPCVNRSLRDFAVVDAPNAKGGRAIVFGLGAVKGIGDGAIEAILQGRTQQHSEGPCAASPKHFVSLHQFCEHVDLRKITKKALEALIKSGAMDQFGSPRARLYQLIDAAYEHGQRQARDRLVGQSSLFARLGAAEGGAAASAESADGSGMLVKELAEWPEKERLAFEKEALGFYITGHPLEAYQGELSRLTTATTANLQALSQGAARGRKEVCLAGIVSALRERPLKSGNGRMAFVRFEDRLGQIEVLVFSKVFAQSEQALRSGEPLLCTGVPHIEGDDEAGRPSLKLRASRFDLLSDIREQASEALTLTLALAGTSQALLDQLRAALSAHPGNARVSLFVEAAGSYRVAVELPATLRVRCSETLLATLKALSPHLRVEAHLARKASAATTTPVASDQNDLDLALQAI